MRVFRKIIKKNKNEWTLSIASEDATEYKKLPISNSFMKDMQFLNQHWKNQVIDKIDIMLKDFDTNKISTMNYISDIMESNEGLKSFERLKSNNFTIFIYHLILTFNKYDKKHELFQYFNNQLELLKFVQIHDIELYRLEPHKQKIILNFLINLCINNKKIIKFNFNFIIGLEYVEAKYLKQYSKLFFAIDKQNIKIKLPIGNMYYSDSKQIKSNYILQHLNLFLDQYPNENIIINLDGVCFSKHDRYGSKINNLDVIKNKINDKKHKFIMDEKQYTFEDKYIQWFINWDIPKKNFEKVKLRKNKN